MGAYEFDTDFQLKLLGSVVKSKRTMRENLALLDASLWDDEVLGSVAHVMLEFWNKYKALPDRTSVEQELHPNVAPGRNWSEYKNVVASVFSNGGFEPAYYIGQARKFVHAQNLLSAVVEARSLIEAGEPDRVVGIIRKAAESSMPILNIKDWFGSLKERALNYKSGKQKADRVPTGFSVVDDITNGGLARGELGAVMAPPKGGKSTTLCNIGRGAILSGKRVLHITLELSEGMISSKYDTLFFGKSMNVINKKPGKFYRAMQAMREVLEGKLEVVEFPTKSLTASELSGMVSSREPDVLILDYADLMRSGRRSEQRRFELIDIWESLRGIAGEFSIAVWTGTQANRMSINQNVVGMENAAECFEKMAICDFVLSVCQTQDESDISRLRLYVPASRISEARLEIPCICDWKKSLIREELQDELDKTPRSSVG